MIYDKMGINIVSECMWMCKFIVNCVFIIIEIVSRCIDNL